MLNVSERSVASASKVQGRGAPELVRAVEQDPLAGIGAGGGIFGGALGRLFGGGRETGGPVTADRGLPTPARRCVRAIWQGLNGPALQCIY